MDFEFIVTSVHKTADESFRKKDMFTIFAAGSVPCPGVMTISLFALTLGNYTLALLSAVSMSLGMGITIFISALLAGSLRQKSTLFFPKLERVYGVIGALTVIGLGLVLADASFTQTTHHRPF